MAYLLHTGTSTNPNLSTTEVLLVVFGCKALDAYKYVLVLSGGVGGKESIPTLPLSLLSPLLALSLSFPLILGFFQSLNFKHCLTFTSQLSNLSSLDCLSTEPGQELSTLQGSFRWSSLS